jgi:glutathione peroxidase
MIDRRSFVALGAAAAASPALAQVSTRTCYTMSFERLHGDGEIRLGDYAGKPILVVNTASLCGFTPQFEGLQALWSQLRPHGLMIIGAPSNDFGGQEPGGPNEIQHTAGHYGVSFPMAAKVKVTGPDAHPFYRWAAAEKPREVPRWNFHKYLVGQDGHIAASFDTSLAPMDNRVIAAIEKEFTSRAG